MLPGRSILLLVLLAVLERQLGVGPIVAAHAHVAATLPPVEYSGCLLYVADHLIKGWI
jgi:hypothetical protein